MNEHLVGKHRIKTTVGFEGARIGVNLIISSVQSHIEGDMDVRGRINGVRVKALTPLVAD